MNRRNPLRVERLEERETRDASLGLVTALPATAPLADQGPPDALLHAVDSPQGVGACGDFALQATFDEEGPPGQAPHYRADALFSDPEALGGCLPPEAGAAPLGMVARAARDASLDERAPGQAPHHRADTLFSDPEALEGCRPHFAETLPQRGPEALSRPDSPSSPPPREAAPDERAGGSAKAPGPDAVLPGWLFLCNYTRKAIRNDEARRGALPDHEDVQQQVYLEWREEVGAGQGALGNLLRDESPERRALRGVVPRVIGRARYDHNRKKAMLQLVDRASPRSPAGQDCLDARIDRACGVANLSPRERRLLELREQGATFEEIGTELRMSKQRVCEALRAAIGRLRKVYSA
jgi:hypothetical protein